MRATWVCVAVVVLTAASEGSAYKVFQEKIPNGDNVLGVQALGHERPDSGGPNNDFGLDFIGAMFKWTKELCEKDSDGDGQTNGQELGDPCCEFVFHKNPVVRWTEGVSHPGDAEYKSDPKLWEGIVCGADAEATEAEETKEQAEVETKEAVEEKEESLEEKEESVEETKEKVAVQGEGGSAVEAAGAPALFSSMVLSVAALSVVLVYLVVVRKGRRATRLPIFRQQRRGPM